MKRLKKALALALGVLMALTALTGCGGGSGTATSGGSGSGTGSSAASSGTSGSSSTSGSSGSASQTPSGTLSGAVNTDGSTSMADVMGILQETFWELQPDVNVNYTGSGSGSGISGVLAGTCDIGLSSRELKEEEIAEGAVAHVVALDGVAVIVNPACPVSELTVEQIADIYTGKVTNWKDLGGADAPIAVYGREDGSGTRSAFEEIVGVEGACVYTNEYGSTGDVIGNVASNENAIGYASLSAVDERVSAIKVNGIAPSEDTVRDGSYAIQRPFLMVTKEGVALSDAAQAFLDYATSPVVADYIAQAGAVYPS